MTLNEILKAKGISDELITAVLDEMKANKIFTSAEENIDIMIFLCEIEVSAYVDT